MNIVIRYIGGNMFDKIIDRVDAYSRIIKRTSVRAIVKKDERYLMIQSNRGDLLFPGGGIECGETRENAVIRELEEETGYRAKGEIKYIGRVITRRPDRFEADCTYETELLCYTCDVEDETVDLRLSESEMCYQIQPMWKTIHEISQQNRIYDDKLGDRDVWTEMVEFVIGEIERSIV